MNKKLIVAVIVVLAVFAAGAIWYYLGQSATNYNDRLTTSQQSAIVSYLNTYHLQGAVAVKDYPPNGEATWIVKSDNTTILLNTHDLGYNGWGQPNYIADNLENLSGMSGGALLEDEVEIIQYPTGQDATSGEKPNLIDISKYFDGHSVDPFWQSQWQQTRESNFWYWQMQGGGISPDGNYSINLGYNREILELDKVIKNGGQISYQPVSLLPGSNYLWSPDNNYILLKDLYGKMLGVYDISAATTTFLIDKNTGLMDMQNGSSVSTGTFEIGATEMTITKSNGATTSMLTTLEPTSTSKAVFLDTDASFGKGVGVVGFIR